MAFPDTPYVTAQRISGGPLTDPSPYVDLSLLGAEFWALVDTSDGTKGRVFKEDETELAVVWLSFDDSAETGGLRFKWSGTWSAAGANTIRIYPPLAARASVASGDTFGKFNAFDVNWRMYLTLDQAANTISGGYPDETGNGNDGTGVNMSLPAVAGQVGDAQDFDGSADYIRVTDDPSLDITEAISLFAWVNIDVQSEVDEDSIISKFTGAGRGYLFRYDSRKDELDALMGDVTGAGIASNSVSIEGALHFVGTTWDKVSTTITAYLDGSELPVTATFSNSLGTSVEDLHIGSSFHNPVDRLRGLIDEAQVHSTARSAEWIAEEFAATKNPGTYWGVWEFVDGGAPPSFDDDVIELTVVMAREQALEVVMAQEQDLEVTMAQEQKLTVVI